MTKEDASVWRDFPNPLTFADRGIDSAIAQIEGALPHMMWRIQREKAEDELASLRARRAQIDGTLNSTPRRESGAGILQFGYTVDDVRNPASGLMTRAEYRRSGRWLD